MERRAIAVYLAVLLLPVHVSHVKKMKKITELGNSFSLQLLDPTPCGGPCRLGLTQTVGHVRSNRKAHPSPAFGMSVLPNHEAISYVTESYCVGMCVVFFCFCFVFFRLLINKYNTSWPCVAGSYSVFPGDCLLYSKTLLTNSTVCLNPRGHVSISLL